jgi:hypothetical protein
MNCEVCNAEVLAVTERTWQDLEVCTACYRALSRAVLIGIQPARTAVTCRDCEQVVSGEVPACPHCDCELANRPDGWPRLPQDALQPLPESEAARLRETEEELIASSKPEIAALLANGHSLQSYEDAYDRLRDELSQLRMAKQAAPVHSTGAFSEAYERALMRTTEAIVGFKLDFVTRYIWARWPGQGAPDDHPETTEPASPSPASQSRGVRFPSTRAALRGFAPFAATGLMLIAAVAVTAWVVKSQAVSQSALQTPGLRQTPAESEAPAALSRRALQEQTIKDLQAELVKLQQEAAEAKAAAAEREPGTAQATDEPTTVAFVLDQTGSLRQPQAPGREALSDADARNPLEVAKADVLDAISRLDESERFCIVAYAGDRLEQYPNFGAEIASASNKERAASFLHNLHLGEGAAGPSQAHPYAAMVQALYRNPHEMYVYAGADDSSPAESVSSLELESLLLHNRNRNSAPIHFRTYGDANSTSPAQWVSALCDQTSGTHRHFSR